MASWRILTAPFGVPGENHEDVIVGFVIAQVVLDLGCRIDNPKRRVRGRAIPVLSHGTLVPL